MIRHLLLLLMLLNLTTFVLARSAESYFEQGFAAVKQRHFAEATTYFSKVIALDTLLDEAYFYRGLVLQDFVTAGFYGFCAGNMDIIIFS